MRRPRASGLGRPTWPATPRRLVTISVGRWPAAAAVGEVHRWAYAVSLLYRTRRQVEQYHWPDQSSAAPRNSPLRRKAARPGRRPGHRWDLAAVAQATLCSLSPPPLRWALERREGLGLRLLPRRRVPHGTRVNPSRRRPIRTLQGLRSPGTPVPVDATMAVEVRPVRLARLASSLPGNGCAPLRWRTRKPGRLP